MTTTELNPQESPKRTRRGKRRRRECLREGCRKKPGEGFDYHHPLCRAVDQLLTRTREDVLLLGAGTAASRNWADAVALSDALSAFFRSQGLVKSMLNQLDESSEALSRNPETYYPATESENQQ